MRAFRFRLLTVLACFVAVALGAAGPTYANCANPASIQASKATALPYNSCGINGFGQFWAHKKAIWNVAGPAGCLASTCGIDSGILTNNAVDQGGGSYKFLGDWINTGVDGCITQDIPGGEGNDPCVPGQCDACPAGPGQCPCNTLGDCTDPYALACNHPQDLLPTDFVIAGQDPSNLTKSLVYYGSVDFNQCSQQWAVENAGATVGDGNFCLATDPNANCNRVAAQQNCAPVPAPQVSTTCTGVGCSPAIASNQVKLSLTFPAQTVPYADDCAVAASSSVNCPRNLDAGRVLMIRRGLCSQPPRNNTANYTTAQIRFWHPWNAGDLDFNGTVDVGGAVNGFNPGPPNQTTSPSSDTNPSGNVIPSGAGTGTIVLTSGSGRCMTAQTCSGGTNPGVTCLNNNACLGGGLCAGGVLQATVCTSDAQCTAPARCAQCLWLGFAAAADNSPPFSSTHTPWVAPYVSINGQGPINLGGACSGGTCNPNSPCGSTGDVSCTACGGTCTALAAPATPSTDRVMDLVASKSGGKTTVAWDTSAELNTSGFKVMGQRKSGNPFQIGPSFIEATGKTDGQSHHYSVDLSGGDLKGSTKIYIVVVHPSGPDETFGPVNL